MSGNIWVEVGHGKVSSFVRNGPASQETGLEKIGIYVVVYIHTEEGRDVVGIRKTYWNGALC